MTRLLRPLGLSLLAFLAGLLPALRYAPDPHLVVTAALIVGVLVTIRTRAGRETGDGRGPRDGRGGRAAGPLAFGLCLALAGAAAGAWGARDAAGDCRAAIPEGTAARAEGVLGAGTARPDAGGMVPILPLEHATLKAVGGAASCAAPIRVRLGDGVPPAPAGSRIEIEGEWVKAGGRVVPTGWPGNPFYAGYLAADTILRLEPPSAARNPLLAMRGRTETALRRLLPRHAPLAEALILGRRERLDPAMEERFTRSGLVHLLAISGSHVGLFAAMLLIFGAAARLSRTRVAWLCIVVVAWYLAMIGAPASAVRSGIMLSLALLALILQRPAAAVPVMAAAALAILALSPRTVLNPGFQLSFAGVIGILVARRVVLGRIPRDLLRRPLVRPLVESITISAAAFASTAPIVAHHFGQIAPVAILANLVAAPATALALSGIVGALAIYPIAPPVAHLLADGASVALDVLDGSASIAARVPLGHIPVPRPDWLAWLFAVAVAALAWHSAPRFHRRARRVIASGAAVALLIAWPALARGERGLLELHFLDVGQGDAIALRTPGDRWVLVDAGPRGRTYDAGARRVLPFLHAHRVKRLEALILTHPDADHIGGAPAVLRGIPVAAIIDPGLPVGKELYAEVLAAVQERGIDWRSARVGHVLRLDGVELTFLWPEPSFLDASSEANDISAVVLVRYGEFEALLTGDVSVAVERRLVELHGDGLAAEILKAGHHGSSTSTSAELLEAVDPELVVITVGRRNRYGHPAPGVVSRIRAGGIEIARTDRDGTVTIRAFAGLGGPWDRIEY